MIASARTRTRRWVVSNIRRLVGTDHVVHLLDRQAALLSRRMADAGMPGPDPGESGCPPEHSVVGWLKDLGGRSESFRRFADLLRHYDTPTRIATLSAFNAVSQASEGSFFRSIYNGVELELPRDSIRTMIQCLRAPLEGPLVIDVEGAHRNWMMSHLGDGGTFLDVGSSTGAITIPVVATFGSSVSVVAFEPARKARRLLEATLARNGLEGVEVVPKAVSNVVGRTTFCEYDYDESGTCPFKPETSAIQSRITDTDRQATEFDVEVTTLDTFRAGRHFGGGPVVVNIDVEGFEVLVLEGASGLIASTRPWFSIDIHRDPFGEGTTEAKVRDLLGSQGYSFENMGHVLVASPC
jgi:FkbM family methyltransferase